MVTMARVILAEDDEAISEPLARALRRDGHEVAVVASGQRALDGASSGVADLMVLDLGLPGMDGIEVIRSLREQGSKMPVIVVTARTSDLDFVVGLDAGADDYVAKPFRIDVLLARVRALVRRGSSPATIRVGELVIDSAARRVRVVDEEVALTPKEYDVLLLLSQNVGNVLLQLNFGNMSKDLALHNLTLAAKKVVPQLSSLFASEWEHRWMPKPLPSAQTSRSGS